MRHAVIVQHDAFEDLGSLASALIEAGYSTEYLQAGVTDLEQVDWS